MKARLDAAAELAKKDAQALARGLAALGAPPKERRDPEREFLLEYAVRERNRALRLVALDAAARLDRKAAAEFFRKRADGKDALVTVTALEALGWVGGKEDVPAVLELARSPSELIAVEACRAAARLGTPKIVDDLIEIGLDHKSSHVTDHAAWALQDLVGKPKTVIEKLERIAAKPNDPRSIRAAATVAMLQDKLAAPHEWPTDLGAVRELVLSAPAAVEIKTSNADHRKAVEAGLQWLRDKLPGAELIVRACAKRIDVPGKQPDGHVDTTEEVIQVPMLWAVQPPHKMAFHLQRMSLVLFEKRIGEPYLGHRGWETAIYDGYDLCAVAGLYDCGPGGLSREQYVADQLDKRPWGGQ